MIDTLDPDGDDPGDPTIVESQNELHATPSPSATKAAHSPAANEQPTTLANLVLVCHHHRLIHHAGWKVHMDDGTPVITKPAWMSPAA